MVEYREKLRALVEIRDEIRKVTKYPKLNKIMIDDNREAYRLA